MQTDMNAQIAQVRLLMEERSPAGRPMAYVRSYGCQQNVADGEKLKGLLEQMGFGFVDRAEGADLILFNTCAVREHAEDRIFGNVGALKNLKRKKPDLIIGVCGCMTEQRAVAERLQKTFPFVNLVFGTHVMHRLPQMLAEVLQARRVLITGGEEKLIREDLPIRRDGGARAWVTAMYGCDNFCSYCIVPYVRGREKSRLPQDIVNECEELVQAGYKEITLLGQNVNSYGKGLSEQVNFAGLLRRIDEIDGDFRLRFMTSHPKDASEELFDVMASSRHIPHHIHLPFQSGNDRVLREMNRRYDREKYLSLIAYARSVMPDITFTSDVIVGFPGETYEEFCDTLSLIEEAVFVNLFTFIYSPRPGTKAAQMPDPISHEEKTKWFAQLLKVQEGIAAKNCQKMVGSEQRVLVESRDQKTGLLSGRTPGSLTVLFPGEENEVGTFARIEVTEARGWTLRGRKI